MDELIKTLKAQTEAMDRLAESIALLVQAMAEGEGEEMEPTTYLDGSPVK